MQPCLSSKPQYVESEEENEIKICTQNVQQTEVRDNGVLSGDLYIVGRLWISALQRALIGPNGDLVPKIHAAKPPEEPKRPPKMKSTDLPIYEKPHYDYKEHIDDKDRCPERNDKLVQQYLLPYVKSYRQFAKQNICCILCMIKRIYCNTFSAINKAKNDFKSTMRDPNNLTKRQAVVGLGTLTGYLVGGGGGLPRRVFFTSVGFLTTGALCFPKETDEVFRTFAFMVGKSIVAMYNVTCKKNKSLPERLPCKDDLPPPSK